MSLVKILNLKTVKHNGLWQSEKANAGVHNKDIILVEFANRISLYIH